MSHHHLTPLTTPLVDTPGPTGASCPAASASSGITQQRQALQDQVDALRQAGALPSASAVGQPGSAVSWNNWSNG